MIRKLYTLLLIGLCLNLAACSDDTEELDKTAAAPTIQFPMEQLDIDLNKADNLPVVAVIKSAVGLKEVHMKIQKAEGTEEYKTVTDFFNKNSYSLSETPNYASGYEAFIIDAVDRLDRVTTATLPFSITDIMGQPEIVFDPSEIIYDEMEENPVMPRTHFTATAEAGLKRIEMYLSTSEGQTQYGQAMTSFENPNEYVFDELVQYRENARGFKVKVEDKYGNVKISTLKVSYRTAPAPELTVSTDPIFADKDETKAVHAKVTSVRGLRTLTVYRMEDGKEVEALKQAMNGEHDWEGDLNILLTNATSGIRIVADDGKKQTEATIVTYVNMVYQEVQIASQFASKSANDKYPGVYSCFSLKDMKTYAADYVIASKDNAKNVDFKFYCYGSTAIPRLYSMDYTGKDSDFGLTGIPAKNMTRFVKLSPDFDFENATAASIEKALADGTIVTSQMTAEVNPCESGDIVAFKTGGSSSSGGNRYGLLKVLGITPPKEIVSANPTARVMTLAIKFPNK